MSDHLSEFPPESHPPDPSDTQTAEGEDTFVLLDKCLSTLPDDAPQQELLYRLRHRLLHEGATQERRDLELKKLGAVVEKLTAPANRIGTLLDVPTEGIARIVVGGSEFYANIDPRLTSDGLKRGAQVLVNEAYTVIKTLGYDLNGPIVKIRDVLADGRLRIDHEPGRPGSFLGRGADLEQLELKAGDEVRLDPSHRLAIEHIENPEAKTHILDEAPTITWDQIGGQKEAISSIRRAIEYPLLHAEKFARYEFEQPRGFLLHGPPGCGKTLIGQATANSLAQLVADPSTAQSSTSLISGGAFLHVKGPEVLNMWVGESERIIRDLFAQARERRKAGLLPFLFIDEAESILGTRRAMRSYNISNTLVPMFCAELDGIESLQDVVVILASNRPDLIDPAVLRPGRIDRKIKVGRPDRKEAANIARIYLTPTLPFDHDLLRAHNDDAVAVSDSLIQDIVTHVYRRDDDARVLSIRLRNGRRETLYRSDLLSGAILASIVRRVKERAIERSIQEADAGITRDDIAIAVKDEYAEGGILPPDDSAEEWLKLLDHHPDQVVSVSPFRKSGVERELSVRTII
jgi:proteasome-associated ATPase